MKLKKWKVLKSKIEFSSPWVRIRRDVVQLPSGQISKDHYVRETKHVVYVFAITTDNKIILENQYKHGAGDFVKEVPAGMVDEHETPLQAGQRELLEETGYTVGKIRNIGQFHGDPTGSNTVIHCFLTIGCRKVAEPQDNPSEVIEVELVTLAQLKRYVREGKINAQGSLAVILLGLQELNEI